MSERFSPEQQQLLALAAVFEAAQLADKRTSEFFTQHLA